MITAARPEQPPAEVVNEPRARHGAGRPPRQSETASEVQPMIAELGHYALMLALGLALIQGTMPIVGARTNDPVLMSIAAPTALAQFAFVAMAFTALAVCYVISDFSVLNVFENSNSQMPFIYRLTSIWGNHEGSMILWVSILTFFGALVAVFGNNLPAVLKANALAVQAWIAAAFHLFILMTSNPFVRIPQAPFEGQDLNPILQDPGLAFHPPLLYLGYVGFSIAFSFAIAALLEGRIDAAWARWVRPWVLGAWMCLTVGIAGGSYWAYYTLGWGGFWFWDPVENASLMPWLAGTALLHSAVVMEKRGALKIWTILLAILTFSLSLIGTFLVRSGVLTSVHTFANDPMRGVFILAILVVFIGGALALYGWRAPLLKQGGLFAPISREGALVFNNLFLTTACASVFIGTLYPLALEALTGAKISVGPPFFNATFGPLFIPLMVVMPFGPLMGWKRGDLFGAAQRLLAAAMLAALAMAAAFAIEQGGPVLAPLGAGVAVFVMAGAVTDIAERTLVLRLPFRAALQRAIGLPRSAWGAAFAHFGIGVTLLGIVAATAWGSERIVEMKVGDNLDIAHYRLTFAGLFGRQGPNYHDLVGRFTVRRMNGDLIGVMEPSRRSFPSRNMTTTQAALMTRGVSQLYLSLGDPMQNGNVAVRLYFKPQVLLIWLGAAIMFAGGALSLSDRRLRVGAPQPAKTKAALRPAG
jgi:cytochrome c-type biogenesis protein CcmF